MRPSGDGLFLVDKPAGPTSHDVVQAARRALRSRHIGHTGTLDPAATGLLVLCVGRATRLQQYLLAWEKTYEGSIRLGWATTTYDTEGEPSSERRAVPPITAERLAELEARFTGELEQLPPPFSAKKTGGKKFYELARAGEEVPRIPKRVTIAAMTLGATGGDCLPFAVTCSSGTYVRSLAHDIGELLGCGGHLAALRRTRVGPWEVAAAVSGETLANRPDELPPNCFIPLDEVALPFPQVSLNPVALDHFWHGQDVVVRDVDGEYAAGGRVVVRRRTGELAGIGVVQSYLPRARTMCVAPRMVLSRVEAGAEA
jgi:tRNA pseudouridine55 synthase